MNNKLSILPDVGFCLLVVPGVRAGSEDAWLGGTKRGALDEFATQFKELPLPSGRDYGSVNRREFGAALPTPRCSIQRLSVKLLCSAV